VVFPVTEVVVCGAGAAGLGAAAVLRRSGVPVLVVERSDGVAASWRARYEELQLNTPGWMAAQPGLRAPRHRYGEFPSRDQWIRYLQDYSEHHRLDIRFGVEVRRLDRTPAGWRIDCGGSTIDARMVVLATGYDHDPHLPDWPGLAEFTGDLVHAANYLNAAPFVDRDVLVVGAGTTGVDLATLLVRGGAGRVRVARRTPPNLVRRKVLGIPIGLIGRMLMPLPRSWTDLAGRRLQRVMFGDLTGIGLPPAPAGVRSTLERHGQGPAYDDGFVALLRSGRIEVVAAVQGFEGADVLLGDGRRIRPNAVIAATGYRRGLEPLVGHLGVLGSDGTPAVHAGVQHPNAPGLFFIGYRMTMAGQMPTMRADARAIGRAVLTLRG
jgi:putative flavoprotein involved in K+ transport